MSIQESLRGLLNRESLSKDYLTLSQKVALADALKPRYEKEAQKRQKAGKPSHESAGRSRHQRETESIIASYLRTSATSLRDMRKLVHSFKEDPLLYQDLVDQVDKGKIRLNAAMIKAFPDQYSKPKSIEWPVLNVTSKFEDSKDKMAVVQLLLLKESGETNDDFAKSLQSILSFIVRNQGRKCEVSIKDADLLKAVKGRDQRLDKYQGSRSSTDLLSNPKVAERLSRYLVANKYEDADTVDFQNAVNEGIKAWVDLTFDEAFARIEKPKDQNDQPAFKINSQINWTGIRFKEDAQNEAIEAGKKVQEALEAGLVRPKDVGLRKTN